MENLSAWKNDENLTYGRIESARMKLAKVLNEIESLNTDVKSACSIAGWNDEVTCQIDEAATCLGYALATLTRWNDDAKDDV